MKIVKSDISPTKEKIRSLVNQYKGIFKNEFTAWSKAHREKVDLQANKFSELKGDLIVQRLLFEVPETLHNIFKIKFNDEDWKYFDSREGARWFAREFPEFRVTEKV